MNNILNIIKYFDIFGYQVNLNYNKKGSSVNTVFGGLISLTLIILSLMLFFT